MTITNYEGKNMRRKWIMVPLAILATVLFPIIGGELVLHLWNWLAPVLFGWRQITFWQALGLLALCRILFGGFGWHRPGRGGLRRRIGERCNMTPEERERFRETMRARWGAGAGVGESKGQ
jgi:hypothetical protein